jgi:hypothetical protein
VSGGKHDSAAFRGTFPVVASSSLVLREEIMSIEYTVVDGRRVIVGLSIVETAEFERLDAQIPLNAKPVWPDTANSALENRWLGLYTKHEIARHASHRRLAAYEQRLA